MSSTKFLFCDLCLIMLFGLTSVCADDKAASVPIDEGPKGNCSCGGFTSSKIEADAAPLLSQTSGLIVKCDDEGANTCKTLCTALATATKAKGPEVLCSRLKDATELTLSVFYKICDKPWTYGEMTAEEPLCCADSQVKVCDSVAKDNSTEAAISKVLL